MVRTVTFYSGEEPRGALKLEPAYADAVTNLVSVVGREKPSDAGTAQRLLASWLGGRNEERLVLSAGLTRCLADPAYLRLHLDHLKSLRAPMLPCEDQIPEDRVTRLLKRGPFTLSDGELASLALSKEQLLSVRREIGENLTHYWVEAIETAMSQAARELGQPRLSTRALMEEVRQRIGKLVRPAIREEEPLPPEVRPCGSQESSKNVNAARAVEETDGKFADLGHDPKIPAPLVLKYLKSQLQRCNSRIGEELIQGLLRLAEEARTHAIERCRELTAEIANRFCASASWLYCLHDSCSLNAIAQPGARDLDPHLSLNQDSMVAYVARTRRALCVADVKSYPPMEHGRAQYRASIPETRSAMAVPVLWNGENGDEVLGVLQLESTHLGTFSAAQLINLKASVRYLTPHLLVLRALDRSGPGWCSWHPEFHGWDLSRVLRRICYGIQQVDPAGLECLVWAVDDVDEQKKQLYVCATTGWAAEFFTRKMHPFESFNGDVAQCPPGSMGSWSLKENEGWPQVTYPDESGQLRVRQGTWAFRTNSYQDYHDVLRVLSAPIHMSRSWNPPQTARATLSIVCRDEKAARFLPDREGMTQSTTLLAELIAGYYQLRKELGRAHLQSALYNRRESEAGFEAVLMVLKEIFELDAGSLWARRDARPATKLEAVATLTGFEEKPESVLRALRGPDVLGALYSYNPQLGEDKGSMTVELADEQPGIVIRRNTREQFSRRRRRSKWRDILPSGDRLDYRFMGLGFQDGGETQGVVRLIRSGHKRPFAVSEGELLFHLMSECGDVLRDWREQPSEPLYLASEKDEETLQAEAERAVQGPVRAIQAPETPVRELLQALLSWFSRREPLQASLVIEHPLSEEKDRFQYYSYLSPLHSVPPEDQPASSVLRGFGSKSLAEITSEAKATSFCRNQPGSDVLSGLRMPVLLLDGDGNAIRGALALDFSSSDEPIMSEHLAVLLKAVHRLAVIFGPAAVRSLPEMPKHDPLRTVLENLQVMARNKGLEVDIRRVKGRELEVVGIGGRHLDLTPAEGESELDRGTTLDLKTYGVQLGRESDGRFSFSLPLRIGPCPVARLDGVFSKGWSPKEEHRVKELRELVVKIVEYWTVAAHGLSVRGDRANRQLRFTEYLGFEGDEPTRAGDDDVTVWHPNVNWPDVRTLQKNGRACSSSQHFGTREDSQTDETC